VTDSDNLELKKRARRRLVGAAALALLAAIVLPMVMDHEPASPAQDIQVSIPDRDADSALARPIAGRDEPTPEPQIAPPPEEAAPVSGGSDAEAPSRARIVAPEPVPKPAASQKAPEQSMPASKKMQQSESDDAARVRALLENKPVIPKVVKETFVVQVGAFGEAGAAASVSGDLKKKGFSAYTEKADAVTRVRIGPFPSRDAAEKVVVRLRAAGLNGVVAPR
jgi:DedD protein